MESPVLLIASLAALYNYPKKLLSGPEAFGIGLAYSLGANFIIVESVISIIKSNGLIDIFGHSICNGLVFVSFAVSVLIGGYSTASTYEDGRVQSLVLVTGISMLLGGFICRLITSAISPQMGWLCYLSIPALLFFCGYMRGFKVEVEKHNV